MPKKTTSIGLMIWTIFMVAGCKFIPGPPLKAPPRLSGKSSDDFINQESISLERSSDGTSMTIAFETKEAAQCKLGFYPVNGPATKDTPKDCVTSSAKKFSETISPIPKDQMITVVIKVWPSKETEGSARVIIIPEASPNLGDQSISLLLVDLGAGRLDITSTASGANPSELMAQRTAVGDQKCSPLDQSPQASALSRSTILIKGATSRGFINSSTTRVSPSVMGANFSAIQRDSTEWNVTARSSKGFGQLRLAKPTLLSSVIFSGQSQLQGNEDNLEDTDPPVVFLNTGSTMVASWTLSGTEANAVATLTIAPFGSFPGIICRAPASSQKITVPGNLLAGVPTTSRIWATLRLDSWQHIEKERWLVRVSDWRSTGVQRR
jgi:hypothetical protein